jgi:hypothetical protein
LGDEDTAGVVAADEQVGEQGEALQVIPVGAGPVNPLAAFVFGFLRRGVGVLR